MYGGNEPLTLYAASVVRWSLSSCPAGHSQFAVLAFNPLMPQSLRMHFVVFASDFTAWLRKLKTKSKAVGKIPLNNFPEPTERSSELHPRCRRVPISGGFGRALRALRHSRTPGRPLTFIQRLSEISTRYSYQTSGTTAVLPV